MATDSFYPHYTAEISAATHAMPTYYAENLGRKAHLYTACPKASFDLTGEAIDPASTAAADLCAWCRKEWSRVAQENTQIKVIDADRQFGRVCEGKRGMVVEVGGQTLARLGSAYYEVDAASGALGALFAAGDLKVVLKALARRASSAARA